MKNQLITLSAALFLSLGMFSCKKAYDDQNLSPLAQHMADIPVTVTNADAFERFPIIYTSIAAGGRFTINFQIPADKGQIKEITKVATGTAGAISLANLNSASAATALNATGTGAARVVQPIAGNNTNSISYTSDLATYLPYRITNGSTFGVAGPQVGPPLVPGGPPTGPVTMPVPPSATSQTPTEIQYYFLITLMDGTTVIPQPVRIRVQP